MKIILKDVKIKGFDPNFLQEKTSKAGKPYTKSFVAVDTTDEQKDLIYNALDQQKPYYNSAGENVFDRFGHIPLFNDQGVKLEEPINFEFLADVSIFCEYSNGYAKTECLGIMFKSKIEGGQTITFKPTFETFDDIFGCDETLDLSQLAKKEEPVAPIADGDDDLLF